MSEVEVTIPEVVVGRTVSELDELIAAANEEKKAAAERAKADFYAMVEKIKSDAEVLGVKLKDVFFPKGEKKVAFRDPNNAENVWSGKGKLPNWLKELVKDIPEESKKEACEAYRVS